MNIELSTPALVSTIFPDDTKTIIFSKSIFPNDTKTIITRTLMEFHFLPFWKVQLLLNGSMPLNYIVLGHYNDIINSSYYFEKIKLYHLKLYSKLYLKLSKCTINTLKYNSYYTLHPSSILPLSWMTLYENTQLPIFLIPLKQMKNYTLPPKIYSQLHFTPQTFFFFYPK